MAKMISKALIFLNGEEPNSFPSFSTYNIVISVDGAYDYLKKNNLIPDVILGDLDSLKSSVENVRVIKRYDQNYTDFEKAIIEIKDIYDHVDVYGASGKEQDHFLGNLSVALKYKTDIKITFYDNYQRYFFSETIQSVKVRPYCKISLIPFSRVKNISTSGLKYELNNDTLEIHSHISIRNEAIIDSISLKYDDGELLIFVEN